MADAFSAGASPYPPFKTSLAASPSPHAGLAEPGQLFPFLNESPSPHTGPRPRSPFLSCMAHVSFPVRGAGLATFFPEKERVLSFPARGASPICRSQNWPYPAFLCRPRRLRAAFALIMNRSSSSLPRREPRGGPAITYSIQPRLFAATPCVALRKRGCFPAGTAFFVGAARAAFLHGKGPASRTRAPAIGNGWERAAAGARTTPRHSERALCARTRHVRKATALQGERYGLEAPFLRERKGCAVFLR